MNLFYGVEALWHVRKFMRKANPLSRSANAGMNSLDSWIPAAAAYVL
jgi:hypothetical protein